MNNSFQTSWTALSKLLASPGEDADEIIAMFRQVVTDQQSQSQSESHPSQSQSHLVPVNVRLWHIPGCHELLASLGFDLAEVGAEDVLLKTGRTANKRQIQFALQVSNLSNFKYCNWFGIKLESCGTVFNFTKN